MTARNRCPVCLSAQTLRRCNDHRIEVILLSRDVAMKKGKAGISHSKIQRLRLQ